MEGNMHAFVLVCNVYSRRQVAMEEAEHAEADRDLALKKAAYKEEVNIAEAAADFAIQMEKAKQAQAVSTYRGRAA